MKNSTAIPCAEIITFSVPRAVLMEIVELTADLTARMHELLERNTDGALNDIEKAELAQLVRINRLGEIISMALQPQAPSRS